MLQVDLALSHIAWCLYVLKVSYPFTICDDEVVVIAARLITDAVPDILHKYDVVPETERAHLHSTAGNIHLICCDSFPPQHLLPPPTLLQRIPG